MTTPKCGLTTIPPDGPCHACEEPAVVEWLATYVAEDGTFMESFLAVCEGHLRTVRRGTLAHRVGTAVFWGVATVALASLAVEEVGRGK